MKIRLFLYFLIFFTPIFCSIPFTANDLHQLERLSGPSVSPDGKYVVFSIQRWDPLSGQKSNNLKYTRISDKQTFDLTSPTHGIYDTNPVFSTQYPNFVFFLSNRNGVNEIYYKFFPSNTTTLNTLRNRYR